MNENNKVVLITVGHTAAGKSTLAQAISDKCNMVYISAGDIKRSFTENYSAQNSLDDLLMDKGYDGATKKAIEVLQKEDSVLVDATFYQKKRRIVIDYEIRKNFEKVIIVWLYCYCLDYEKVINRIKKRSEMPENAGNQADDVAVYSHILVNFDDVNIEHFSENTIIVHIDTNCNKLKKIEGNFNFLSTNNNQLSSTLLFIEMYLNSKK